MRQPARVVRLLRYVVILAALCTAARAHADDRADARAHYQAGVKFYAGGDYQGAIREFSAAQQLVPADLNNYNLALCYDKLGDAEPAIQYYRAFLDKQPGSDKRAEIEASINRLEAASRSAASKKAAEAKRAEDARKAEDARRATRSDDVAGPTAPPPAGPVMGPPPPPGAAPGPGPEAAPVLGPAPPPAPGAAIGDRPEKTDKSDKSDKKKKSGPAIAGSIGTPSTATPVPTGDSQLDRVNAINIDEIREQRMGGAAGPASAAGPGGPAEHRSGPAVAASEPPPAQAGPSGPNGPQPMAPNSQPGGQDVPKKEDPVYKKWWFWAVVAVTGVVVYSIATDNSSAPSRTARETPTAHAAVPQPGGLTLLRW